MASLSFVDVCSVDYLQDHHNRDGEALVGALVDSRMTVGKLLTHLRWEFHTNFDETLLSEDEFDAALESAFAHENRARIFYPDAPAESDGETVAWFLLTWEARA